MKHLLGVRRGCPAWETRPLATDPRTLPIFSLSSAQTFFTPTHLRSPPFLFYFLAGALTPWRIVSRAPCWLCVRVHVFTPEPTFGSRTTSRRCRCGGSSASRAARDGMRRSRTGAADPPGALTTGKTWPLQMFFARSGPFRSVVGMWWSLAPKGTWVSMIYGGHV